ncbi:hypothetical protein [Bacillus mobilis]|uniref:hypothetical protein n=2 Tax=Bacillus mobilis TaxID=2026190 RepID=UPI00362D04BD
MKNNYTMDSKHILIGEWMILKRIFGVLSTSLIAGVMVFGVSNIEAKAAETTDKPYKVVEPGFNGDQTTIGFDTKADFENHIKTHPVPKNSTIKPLAAIYSTFYHDINSSGPNFTVNASRNPVVVTNFAGWSNDAVSSVRTHSYGDHTIIYEHANAQGRGLALANTGAVYNLTNYSMGDGARTWNDEASSTIVKSN